MKPKTIYNLISSLTLILPISVYMILMATVFQIKADAVVGGKVEQVEVLKDDNFLYAHALTEEVTFNGLVVQHEGVMALRFDTEDIIKFKDGYFQFKLDYTDKKITEPIDTWVDVKMFEMKKQMSYKLPLSVIFSIVGALIVAAVISNKMQWHKKHPRLATFLALLTGTVILWLINSFIGSVLGVFAVATASFGLYYIEWLAYQNKIKEKDSEKAKSELTSILEDALRGLK